ncbi:hypothetical protein FJZ28_02165 [Candidatus Peregrinibacteria bacterium]|nr:hypothetical protein [Candidatus Peregrinibacteria bacterium]
MQSVRNFITLGCVAALLGLSAIILAGVNTGVYYIWLGIDETLSPNRLFLLIALAGSCLVVWSVSCMFAVRNYSRKRPVRSMIAAAFPMIAFIILQVTLARL